MASLRALGDIQRRGLEAANLVVARLISPVDRRGPLFGAEPPADGPSSRTNGDAPSGPPEVGELVDLYTSLLSSFMTSLLGAGPAPAGGSDRAAPSTVSADPLSLPPARPGGRSESELWLHNRSGAPVADVRVHCGDLRRHDGHAMPSSVVSFDPGRLDELPDLTSRGIRVAVEVPEGAAPGTYRGTVLAANLPDLWLVLEVEVLSPP
jgi:hypothetical protein